MLLNRNWTSLLFIIPCVLFSLSVHEFFHAYVALKLGDVSQKERGRLTLNPLNHFSWVGLACIILIGFGWGKPVMIDPTGFIKPSDTPYDAKRKDMKHGVALESIAGPLSNFILGFIAILLFTATCKIFPGISFDPTYQEIKNPVTIWITMLYTLAQYNVALGMFNMIPIPPLDGSKVFAVFLPEPLYFRFIQVKNHLSVAILTIVVFISVFVIAFVSIDVLYGYIYVADMLITMPGLIFFIGGICAIIIIALKISKQKTATQ